MTEAIRHDVFEAFRASHGRELAAKLMQLLPPAGVPELATKADVEVLRVEMAGEFALVREEMRSLEARVTALFHQELKQQGDRYLRYMLAALTVFTTLAAIVQFS